MKKFKRGTKLIACFLAAFLLISALPIVSLADDGTLESPNVCSPNYYITPISAYAFSRSNVNLRFYPSTSAPAYTPLLAYRTPLHIIGVTQGDDNYTWYQVNPTSGPLAGKTGFVRSDCLEFIESGASVGPEAG